MAVQNTDYYTDKAFTERSIAKGTERDDLEEAWLNNEINAAASKVDELVQKHSKSPEFLTKVLSRVLNKRLPRQERYEDSN